MNRIDVFCIATGVYASYFDVFLGTIHNFVPGFEKHVHVISDSLNEFDGFCNKESNVSVSVEKIIDMPYPIIPLCKSYFVKNFMPEDCEYVFYVDIDSIFMEKSEEFWKNFVLEMESGEVMVSHHPANMYPDYKIIDESAAFIPAGSFYFPIISSFYGGMAKSILQVFDQMDDKIKHDLTFHVENHQEHYIPPLFDQDYLTKTVYDSNGLSFLVKYFVRIGWLSNENDVLEENVVEQKYDISRKFKKKNMI